MLLQCTHLLLFGIVLEQLEKSKQDDALSDLSNVLGELRNMAADMGAEFDRWLFLYDTQQHLLINLVQMFAILFHRSLIVNIRVVLPDCKKWSQNALFKKLCCLR